MLIGAAAAAKLLQSCPTLCDPIDGSPPGSTVPGILQARTLEWVAISFSNAWKWKVKVKSLSRVRLVATPRTAAYQAPPSMGFSRQEYWSRVPLPSPVSWGEGHKYLSIIPFTCQWIFGLLPLPLLWIMLGMNMGVHIFECLFSIILGIHPEVKLLDGMAILFDFFFLKNHQTAFHSEWTMLYSY